MSLEADLIKRNVWGWLVNHLYLSVICPKDTAGRGETSSPDDVIEVVIDGKQKLQRVRLESGWRSFRGLEQIEFFRAADGRPTIVDPQFIENIFGVCAQGVERHDQAFGNFGSA